MAESQHEFERFFNREGFNRSLSHFQAVSSLLEDFEDGYSLCDILNTLLAEKEITQDQVNPILYALLIDKYGYSSDTHNMESTIEDFEHLKAECGTWNGIDIVVAYHHPDLGITLLNPKNPVQWDIVQNIRKNELVTIYAGGFAEEISPKTAEKGIETLIRFLEGKSIKSPAVLLKGGFVYQPYNDEEEEQAPAVSSPSREGPKRTREPIRASASSPESASDDDGDEDDTAEGSDNVPPAPKPVAAAPSGSRRMTPMYSVPVTNELFHNGNVEAWKKIIQSYQIKYPDTDVLVFYDGERIHDINTLFKWGKVTHGSAILFALVGEDIKDAAKLQRYFRQGASSQFEAFLRVPVNTALKLF